MSDDRNLKIVSNPESKNKTKFINSDKMYKIPGAAIIAVNDFLKFINSGVDSNSITSRMRFLKFIVEFSEYFRAENFEEVETDAEKGCQSGAE